MNLIEIKKELYKQKPTAKEVEAIEKDNLTGVDPYSVYWASLGHSIVKFVIPHSDMGENRFEKEVPAQLLIRWLVW